VRNSPADTKVNEKGERGGAAGTRAENPLQLMEETMVEQVFSCSLWKDHAGADIHTTVCGRKCAGAGGYGLKEL